MGDDQDKLEITDLVEDEASLLEFSQLCAEIDPLADTQPVDVDAIRRWDSMVGEHLRIAVRDGNGSLVAAGAIYGQPHDPASQDLPCQVLVPERLHDSGLADAILARLTDWARQRRQAPRISVGISETDGIRVTFWTDRGLRVANRYVELELRLDEHVPHEQAGGPRIVSLAGSPHLLPDAWQVVRDTWQDMPGGHSVPPPLDQWRADFDDGRSPMGGAFLALDEAGRSVGVITPAVTPGDLDEARTAYLGVRSECRGRGLATALKFAQLAWCRSAGYRRMTTGNHADNAAMLRINERVGFRTTKVVLQMQASLDDMISPAR